MTETAVENILDEDLYCIGCGARIQTENKNQAGWLPKSALEKYINNQDGVQELLCNRCFRLRNYNEIQPVEINSDHFTSLLNSIGQKKALVVYVVDLFDVSGSLISGLARFVGDNPVILIGNKFDILPKSVKENKIKIWLENQAKMSNIQVVETLLTRAIKGDTGEQVVELISKYRDFKEIYVVGVTNVGKSTLINQIIKYLNGFGSVITTSRFPGTTLDKIEIPLDSNHDIVDTPGIIHETQMTHFVSERDLKYLLPNKEIKPKTFQLNENQTLYFGGLSWIDFENKNPISITTFFENNLNIHRKKTSENSDFYQKHRGSLLSPIPKIDIEFKTTEILVSKNEDLVISGMGWIAFREETRVKVHVPKDVLVQTRKSEI